VRIYLVQHAEAVTDAVDPRRILSPKGEKTARELANACGKRRPEAMEILHSGKPRARQTAEILAEALGLPVRESSGLNPLDPVRPFLAEIEEWREGRILVGHNPFLERLCATMIAGREEPPVLTFQRGGMACLERLEGSWRLLWTAFPDQPIPQTT
jgi:phosphohistidine phosphatase